ncbi:Protein EDS1B, partial [Mucuna pruriens]
MRGELIQKAYAVSWKAHKSPDKPYLVEKINRIDPPEIIICFPGSGAVNDWYSQKNFGETKIDLGLFPSLRSIGNNEAALVNEASLKRFKELLDKPKPSLADEVQNAMNKNKQIVFAGYSSGGPVAILATLWALEKYQSPKSSKGIPPLCVTFGSPLVGNHIFSHATRRENWSRHFFHYVMRYDIVPRILLAPLSSLDQTFEPISQFFNNPKSNFFMSERANAASYFFFAVMSNAATVTSHAASKLMGSIDTTLETLENFIPLSPYRPFGTYVFCTGNGKLGKQIVIKNPDAVLQVLFFSAQPSTEEEAAQVPCRSLREHTIYGTELQQMETQNVVHLNQLDKLPFSEDGAGAFVSTINTAFNDLGLSPIARLCLQAAAELELRRCDNENKIKEKKGFLEEKMKELQKYRETLEHQKVGFYDGFREHKKGEDFKANVMRLELAGVWDGIIEKLISYELPDEFEGREEWIDLGTRFRQLVEPLDIANYYRHARHYEDDSSSYMVKGRPKRYRYPQRWLEHDQRRPQEPNSASCFWAEVEELRYKATKRNVSFEDVKERVKQLEAQIKGWSDNGELAKDAFVEGSTLVKWWKALPPQHKERSCIRSLIKE